MKSLKNIILVFVLIVSATYLQATSSRSIIDLDLFLQPLNMTTAGLQLFFEQLYNSKRYTEDFFPNNIKCHMNKFLWHGKQTNQKSDYIRVTFSLFSQKLKGCLYVSAYSFAEFLDELPELISYNFEEQTPNTETQKQDVKEVLYQEFLNNFNAFQENPSQFLDTLSERIVAKVQIPVDDPARDAARYGIIRFIELCLSKALWDATDKHVAKNIDQISNAVMRLAESNVIKEIDDLNDIAWSLVQRLAYFIDIVGTELPLEFYEQLRDNLVQNPLFNIEEQEQGIETKRQKLERMVLDGISKKHAQEYGVIA